MLSGVLERRSVTISWYSGTLTDAAIGSRYRAICWAAERPSATASMIVVGPVR